MNYVLLVADPEKEENGGEEHFPERCRGVDLGEGTEEGRADESEEQG